MQQATTTTTTRWTAAKMSMLALALVLAMVGLMVSYGNPALAQTGQYGEGGTVTVTFELTIDGEVPEGRTFSLGYRPIGPLLTDFQGVAFCRTDFEDPEPAVANLPACEDGGVYSGTLEVPAGVPFSYDFLYNADADEVRCDYIGPTEIFDSQTRTFIEDTIVRATYIEDGLPPGCRAVGGSAGAGEQTPLQLPATGGGASLALVAGILLVGAGLLARNTIR